MIEQLGLTIVIIMRYYTTLWSKRKLGVFDRYCKQVILFWAMTWVFCVLNPLPVSSFGDAGRPIGTAPAQHACRPRLGRPVGASAASNKPERFYPYASTGQGQYQVHHGVEFINPRGTPVVAVADGTVVAAGSDEQENWGRHPGYYGLLVAIRLVNSCSEVPIYVLYGHLVQIEVALGQYVRRGDVIGWVGMSGVALGPHLHFEVRVGQNTFYHTRNPELWLEPLTGYGTIAGRVEDGWGHSVEGALVTVHPLEQPDRYWREARTYVGVQQERLGVDAFWNENFTLGDVPVGDYVVRVRAYGGLTTRHITVREKGVAFVSIIAHRGDHLPKIGTNGIMLLP